ncbi:hypothetical protein HN385_07100 [archaeon]|jgi:transcription initiation factor TFIIE subunit alpha|nr:hypothetical protein [archaeon]MBT3450974.1 hypothetical protein [archaeon]MBT6868606.1 hypothetical protein [archaeon]MBT7193138.1 hypothetical protein [archaeon]MBT7381118.1 hypothetical protein [archaeon]
MRLTKKKIDEVIIKILGEVGLDLVSLLKKSDNISEFDLAKKLNKDIKVIRKMLYLLYNHNLVSFTRKKDKQKGWYIYYWTLINESIKFEYIKRRKILLMNLKHLLNKEQNEIFFYCLSECVRLDFDDSSDFDFHCPECGKLLEQDNNEKRIKELNSRIEEISLELKLIEEEKIKAAKKARKKKIESEKKEVKKRKVEKKKVTTTKKKKVTKKKKSTTAKSNLKKKTIIKKKVSKKKNNLEKEIKKSVTKDKKKVAKSKTNSKKKKITKNKEVKKKNIKKKK